MTPIKTSELNEAIREVLKRSVVDAEFRAKALANGNAAIEQVSGKSLAHGTSYTFISNAGAEVKAIVLPDPVSDANLLSEEELEQVAGGRMSCEATSCGTSS